MNNFDKNISDDINKCFLIVYFTTRNKNVCGFVSWHVKILIYGHVNIWNNFRYKN